MAPTVHRKPVPQPQTAQYPRMRDPTHYASRDPEPPPYPPRRPDPVVDALRARGEVLKALPEPRLYYADGGLDGAATNAAHTQRAQAIAANQVLTRLRESDTMGDHQRVTFRSDGGLAIPTAMPQVLTRRGVPPAMFMSDMAKFTELNAVLKSKENKELILGFLTCFISICITGAALDVYNRQMRDYVASMNPRYAPYSVTWSFEFIPFGGSHVTYET